MKATQFGNITKIEDELTKAKQMLQFSEYFESKLLEFEKLKWMTSKKDLF